MNRCYLSLGSNKKFPERQIRTALKNIRAIPCTSISKVSKFEWTKAWGVESQQDFCNALIEVKTTLDPFLLLTHCQKIEKKQGRTRKKHWGPRTIDIDIILYGLRKINQPRLKVPHPYYLERDFIRRPLEELYKVRLTNR